MSSGKREKIPKLEESGNLIADKRSKLGLNQDELAERVNDYLGEKTINRTTISRIENATFDPHLTTFMGIADTLHVTLNELGPRALLIGTPLERYNELDKRSLERLQKMIDVFIETQHEETK